MIAVMIAVQAEIVWRRAQHIAPHVPAVPVAA